MNARGEWPYCNWRKQEGMREMGRQWARSMVHPSRIESSVFERIIDMIGRSDAETFAAQIHALFEVGKWDVKLETEYIARCMIQSRYEQLVCKAAALADTHAHGQLTALFTQDAKLIRPDAEPTVGYDANLR